MIKKTCKFCHKTFWIHSYREKSANFCSRKCYNQYRSKLAYPKRICPICKKYFIITRKTRNRKYCSENCSTLARRKYSRQDKLCLYCKKRIQYNPKNPHQKYCSVICQIKSRAYDVDEKFFEKINSEGKAYLLGLIFSDGSLSQRRLSFSSNDKNLVELYKKLLKSKAPIHQYKNSFSLIIGNQVLCNCLNQLGVLERKSWKEYGLPVIPQRLMWHFLRGIFDGDGSFYINYRDNKLKYLCASFNCGSRKFLEEIQEYLSYNRIKTQNIRFDRKPNDTGCWQLRIARKKDMQEFTKYLYKNSNYFLGRKHKIVKTFYGK